MPFHLTSDQDLIRKTVRELCEEVRGKPAEHVDRERAFPKEHVKKLASLGLTGMLVPAEKGGAGTDTVSFCLALEEVARVSGTLALVLNNLNAYGTAVLARHAGDEAFAAVYPAVLSGDAFLAWALAEPNAGSDTSKLQTRAVEKDGQWRLSGLKSFVVGAPHAKHFLVFAQTKGADAHSLFLVDAASPGIRVAPPERTMAMRGSDMAQVFLKDAPAALVGAEGAGPSIAREAEDVAALGGAAIALGLMQAALDDAVQYSGDREQFRTPIKKFQAIQFLVAQMELELRAARLLTYAAADKRDRGEDFANDAAAAKLYAGEAVKFVTQKSIRIHGGTGFMRDLPVERYNRDGRTLSVYAGTSEAHRAALAAKTLGL